MKKILTFVLAVLMFGTIPVYAADTGQNMEQAVPYIPDGYTEEQWNGMSKEEQWDAFLAQGAVCDIRSDEFENYDTGSIQLMCMAQAGVLDCKVMTLIFYNIDDGNYYWVNTTDFDMPLITLPVGTYQLDCIQYDGKTNVNISTELDPELFTITKDTVLDSEDGIFLWISAAYEEYGQNAFKADLVSYSGYGNGTVSFDLSGQSDVVSDTKDHTYHFKLKDGKIEDERKIYAGDYRISNVKVVDAAGKLVYAYYDGGIIHVTRNTDVVPQTTLYLYRTKADLPSAFLQSLLGDQNTYVSTENVKAIDALTGEDGTAALEEDTENMDVESGGTDDVADNARNSSGTALFGVVVAGLAIFLIIKYKKELLKIVKIFFQ